MKKVNFPVGQKVRGYGILNEFGEFDFVPEQTGSRSGRIRTIKSGDGFTLSHSTRNVFVHLTLPKSDTLTLIKNLMNCVNNVIGALRNYNLS